MNTNHNRIKIADLETNEPNRTLVTNDNGELTFNDIPEKNFKTVNGESIVGSGNITLDGSTSLQQVLNTGNIGIGSSIDLVDIFGNHKNRTYMYNSFIQMTDRNAGFYSMDLNAKVLQFIDDNTKNITKIDATSFTFVKDEGHTGAFVANEIIGHHKWNLPNKSGTVALIDDIPSSGSQTIDQVLEAGNNAIDKNLKITRSVIQDPFNTLDYFVQIDPQGIDIGYDSEWMGSPSVGINPNGISLSRGNGPRASLLNQWVTFTLGDNSSRTQLDAGALQVNGNHSGQVYNSQVRYEDDRIKTEYQNLPGQNGQNRDVFKFPRKFSVDQEFILATTEDINLQKSIEGGNQATRNSGTLTLLGQGKAPYTSVVYTNEAETHSTILSVASTVIDITVDQGEGQAGINLNKSGFRLNFNGQALVSDPVQPNTDYKEVKIPFVTEDSTLALTSDLKLKSYTVSTLPVGSIGDRAYVTDAVSPTYLSTLTGGGATVCPVFYNGTSWVSH